MNYYPRYPAHYVAKTLHLTMEQDGAYTRLLDWYYANERGIPHAQRYAISRAQTPSERRSTDSVLRQFFAQENGVWTNDRTADEIADAQPKIAAARANGRKGGRPKKNPSGSEEKPTGFSTETQGEPSAKAPQSPIPNTPPDSQSNHPPSAEFALEGAFEGHVDPKFTPQPAVQFAMALRSAGFPATSLTPSLAEYAEAGGTIEHLLEVAQLTNCQGKNGAYVAKAALGQLLERATPITAGDSRGTRRNESAAERTRRLAIEGDARDQQAAFAGAGGADLVGADG